MKPLMRIFQPRRWVKLFNRVWRSQKMKRFIVLIVSVFSVLGIAAPPAQAWGNCALYHRVRFGETLASIARFYGTTFPDLAAINHLTNPDFVFAGEVLCVRAYAPPPQQHTYVVQP